jgi:hypothetical protein
MGNRPFREPGYSSHQVAGGWYSSRPLSQAMAKDPALVEQLWLKTEELLGEKFFA